MKLRTIGLISTLVLGLLAGALTAEAQKATKTRKATGSKIIHLPPLFGLTSHEKPYLCWGRPSLTFQGALLVNS